MHPILGTYQWSVLKFGSILLKQNTGLAGHMKHLFNGKNYMVRFLAVRSGPITDSYLALGACSQGQILSPSLDARGGARYHLNLKGSALLKSMGSLPLSAWE